MTRRLVARLVFDAVFVLLNGAAWGVDGHWYSGVAMIGMAIDFEVVTVRLLRHLSP